MELSCSKDSDYILQKGVSGANDSNSTTYRKFSTTQYTSYILQTLLDKKFTVTPLCIFTKMSFHTSVFMIMSILRLIKPMVLELINGLQGVLSAFNQITKKSECNIACLSRHQ